MNAFQFLKGVRYIIDEVDSLLMFVKFELQIKMCIYDVVGINNPIGSKGNNFVFIEDFGSVK